MRGSFKVLDTHRRIIEPQEIWYRHIAAPMRTRALSWGEGRFEARVAGRRVADADEILLASLEPSDAFASASERGFDPASMLADMDREGVDVALLHPTMGSYMCSADHVPADLAASLCRAYNDWLAEYCAAAPDRLKGLALVPLQDASAAVAELRRAAEELGHVGLFLASNPLHRRQHSHSDYYPIYAAAASLQLALWISGSPGSVLPEIGVREVTGKEWPDGLVRFRGAFARHVVTPPFEAMGALASWTAEGTLLDFPSLQVVFVGGGCGWLPFWVDRLEDDYFNRGEDALTPQSPKDYVLKQTAVVARGDECLLDETAEEFPTNLVWGSGYPGVESTSFSDELSALIEHPSLDPDFKRRLLWDNAARRLGIH